jgi:hypothetical protein
MGSAAALLICAPDELAPALQDWAWVSPAQLPMSPRVAPIAQPHDVKRTRVAFVMPVNRALSAAPGTRASYKQSRTERIRVDFPRVGLGRFLHRHAPITQAISVPRGTSLAHSQCMARTSPASVILGARLRAGEQGAIAQILEACCGHTLDDAAKTLGVPRRTLQHWLAQNRHLATHMVDRRTTTGPAKRRKVSPPDDADSTQPGDTTY